MTQLINGLVQERRNSIANTLELCLLLTSGTMFEGAKPLLMMQVCFSYMTSKLKCHKISLAILNDIV